jgi:dihydrofolate reductase
MAALIYTGIASLDGYTADAAGEFDWAMPDEELHAFVNDLERPIGTYLYGRRMYETMAAWETMDTEGEPHVMADFAALWRAADKIVYSSTVTEAWTAKTRIEPAFDPTAVQRMKDESAHDLSIGGPGLASAALRAGLVDECGLFLNPIAVGEGTPFFPRDLRVRLQLVGEHRFASGVVYLRYRVAS